MFPGRCLICAFAFLQSSLRLPLFVPADDGLVADPVDGEPDVAGLVGVFAVLLELAGNGGDLFRLGVGLVVFEGSGWSTPPCCSNLQRPITAPRPNTGQRKAKSRLNKPATNCVKQPLTF